MIDVGIMDELFELLLFFIIYGSLYWPLRCLLGRLQILHGTCLFAYNLRLLFAIPIVCQVCSNTLI